MLDICFYEGIVEKLPFRGEIVIFRGCPFMENKHGCRVKFNEWVPKKIEKYGKQVVIE